MSDNRFAPSAGSLAFLLWVTVGLSGLAVAIGTTGAGDGLQASLQGYRAAWWWFVLATIALQWLHVVVAVRLARADGIAEGSWRPVHGAPRVTPVAALGITLFGIYAGIVLLRFAGALSPVLIEGLGPTERALLPGTLGEGLAFLALAATAAVCEETVYRGFALGLLRRRVGALAAVAVTALAFAVAHAAWVDALVGDAAPRFLIGLALGGLAVWRGHIAWAVLVHFLLDANGVLAR